MENLHQEIQTTHFRYLKEDAIENPFLFFREFCFTETDLELFRQDISAIIHAAGTKKTDHNGKFYKNSDEYVYNHRRIVEALEALWVLHHQSAPELSIQASHPLYQTTRWKRDGIDVEARLDGPAKHYRKLDNMEINNIRLFLKDFFLHSDINEWRETLDDLLSYSHMDESIAHESSYFSRELIPIAEYLEKMAEALFLIAELTLTNTNTERMETGFTNSKLTSPSAISEDAAFASSLSHKALIPSLDNDNFTDGLVQYLSKFWSHLEEDDAGYSYGPVILSETLEKGLLSYFESFHPKFLCRNFRRVYMGYLEHIFETGTPYYDELRIFTSQMDTFFELLELADKETKHWPQENRLGFEEA